MTCDLQAIRERQATLIVGRWDIVPVRGDGITTPWNARDMVGRMIHDDVNALLSEVDRLRAAIEQHRDQVESWNIVNREPAPADEHLWAALDDRPSDRIPDPPPRQPDRALRGYIEQANEGPEL